MGGRGSKSSFAGRSTTTGTVFRQLVGNAQQMQPQVQAQMPPQQQVQNQPPTQNNTPVQPGAADTLSQMSDDQLAQLVTLAKNTQLPNHLNDVDDITQKFIFTAGVNARPTVMDQSAFNQFLADNNIPRSQILSRSIGGASYVVGKTQYDITPQQVVQMFTQSRLTYSGGKQNGQAYGGGTYFDMNGGRSTGYGNTTMIKGKAYKVETMIAALNPKTARVISDSQLARKAQAFAASHPKFARAVGSYNTSFRGGKNNMSIYALAMGYNVIQSGSYHNVIDRSAVVVMQ